jgi:hypothetical protein
MGARSAVVSIAIGVALTTILANYLELHNTEILIGDCPCCETPIKQVRTSHTCAEANVRGQKPASACRFAEGGVERHRWLHRHGREHGARSSVAGMSAFTSSIWTRHFHVRPFYFMTPRLPLQAALAFLHSVVDAN